MKNDKKKEEETKILQTLFEKCKFFISREVPREMFAFVIRACGGLVSWDKSLHAGSTYDVKDETITHQIVDRPNITEMIVNRIYVQPQWIFDSVNARKLLPVENYLPGSILPSHLSPFVEEKEGDYIPSEKLGRRQTDVDEDITEISNNNKNNSSSTNLNATNSQKRKRKDEIVQNLPKTSTNEKKQDSKEERLKSMRVESGKIQKTQC